MRTSSRYVFAVLLSSVAMTTFAQAPMATPRDDARDARQERRIEQGERSGALTPREADRLEKRQQMMEKREEHMKADGKLTPQERMRMERMDNHESRDIAREKADRQHDFNHDGKVDRPQRARRTPTN